MHRKFLDNRWRVLKANGQLVAIFDVLVMPKVLCCTARLVRAIRADRDPAEL